MNGLTINHVMRKIVLLIITLCSISCNQQKSINNEQGQNLQDTVHNSQRDSLLEYLQDSTFVFNNITEMNINGENRDSIVYFKYYSITASEFFDALKRNIENIRYFSREHKINEGLNTSFSLREGNALKLSIGANNEFITLFDMKANRFTTARNFYFHSKIAHYYIIQRIQFEDAETIFLNARTGNADLYIPGLNVFTDVDDSLVFYSDSRKITPADKTPICLFKINDYGIDTLFCLQTEWEATFGFFDKTKNTSLYFIYEITKDNKIYSIYAKVNFLST